MTTQGQCPHFSKTGLKPPRGGQEKMCRACPLRNEKGNCIQDLIDDMGEQVGNEISEAQSEIAAIWRKWNDRKSME